MYPACLARQWIKERRIMNIRVNSLVVLLVARLTRQRMKERGIMDVRSIYVVAGLA